MPLGGGVGGKERCRNIGGEYWWGAGEIGREVERGLLSLLKSIQICTYLVRLR